MQGEHILDALPVQWHRNPFNIIPWTIVVTDARIIVTRLTPEIQKQAVNAKVQEKGGGFLKRMAVATTRRFTLHERYLTMDPETVLTETPENWWVEPPRRLAGHGHAGALGHGPRRPSVAERPSACHRDTAGEVILHVQTIDERRGRSQPPRPGVRRDGDAALGLHRSPPGADDDGVRRPAKRVTVREHMVHVVLEEGAIRHPNPVPERVLRRWHEDLGGPDNARVVTEDEAQNPAAHVEGEL